MLLARLHSAGRNGPELLGQIDLLPASADDLAGPASRQYQQFEGLSGDPFPTSELIHELADLAVREGAVMNDFADRVSGRQQVIEMPMPARWIVAGAISSGGCPIQNRFNPTAQPTGGFGLCAPDRFDRLQYQAGIDGAD